MIKRMPLFVRQKWMTHSTNKHTHSPSVIHTLLTTHTETCTSQGRRQVRTHTHTHTRTHTHTQHKDKKYCWCWGRIERWLTGPIKDAPTPIHPFCPTQKKEHAKTKRAPKLTNSKRGLQINSTDKGTPFGILAQTRSSQLMCKTSENRAGLTD